MNIFIALLLSLMMQAQTREVTDSGAFVIDSSGRYVRLEGRDGVVVDYLYDAQDPAETSGVVVHVNGKRALTVHYGGRGEVAVAGLPKLSTVFDAQGRTTAVLADGAAVARLAYTEGGCFAGISPPGSFAAGYDAAVEDLGVDFAAVTYDFSPTGALTTARDATGRVVFYVVRTDWADVGFSPDGKPRFYDIPLSVEGGEIPPGSDVMVPLSCEGQRGNIPDHLVLTTRGAVGLYVEHHAP